MNVTAFFDSFHQGCQIFLVHDTKTGKNIANEHKTCQMVINYPKVFQVAIKYINIFPSKALQNLPKFGIFVLKRKHLATLVFTRNAKRGASALGQFSFFH
jgi:predicted RNA-binding protein with PIN domain